MARSALAKSATVSSHRRGLRQKRCTGGARPHGALASRLPSVGTLCQASMQYLRKDLGLHALPESLGVTPQRPEGSSEETRASTFAYFDPR